MGWWITDAICVHHGKQLFVLGRCQVCKEKEKLTTDFERVSYLWRKNMHNGDSVCLREQFDLHFDLKITDPDLEEFVNYWEAEEDYGWDTISSYYLGRFCQKTKFINGYCFYCGSSKH